LPNIKIIFLIFSIKLMKAYIFPGQGAQFTGMGKELYENSDVAKTLFEKANQILGFRITDIMFEGTAEELKETKVTQPAVFLHSVILAKTLANFKPEMVAGHSLGEFSALVANNTLSFEDGLRLVSQRALAMQKACEIKPSTMAAVLGLDDKIVEDICASIDGIVVAANYNCPGQLVISGETTAVQKACEVLKEAGARRALLLPVSGAFHSPMMEPAREELAAAIEATTFSTPICPVYQNVTASAVSDPNEIKKNLIIQLTAPVKWTQSVQQMIQDGATLFTEVGPGKVLTGLVNKIDKEAATENA
jgi:[acyl-carrier-protein] S-malonyltransferase